MQIERVTDSHVDAIPSGQEVRRQYIEIDEAFSAIVPSAHQHRALQQKTPESQRPRSATENEALSIGTEDR